MHSECVRKRRINLGWNDLTLLECDKKVYLHTSPWSDVTTGEGVGSMVQRSDKARRAGNKRRSESKWIVASECIVNSNPKS